MKIITKRNGPKDRKHRGNCDKCGSTIEFNESEAKFESYPRNEAAWIAKCPVQNCGGRIYVEA